VTGLQLNDTVPGPATALLIVGAASEPTLARVVAVPVELKYAHAVVATRSPATMMISARGAHDPTRLVTSARSR
jgi:hypothetical protein